MISGLRSPKVAANSARVKGRFNSRINRAQAVKCNSLVDTAELHFTAWARLMRELNRPFTRAEFAATFGLRNPEIIDHLFGKGHFDRSEERRVGKERGCAMLTACS